MSNGIRQKIHTGIKRIAYSTAKSLHAKAEVKYYTGCPPLYCNDELSSLVQSSVQKILGQDKVIPIITPSFGSEDFSYYTANIPGAFFRIGTHNKRSESHLSLHDPHIIFDEKAVITGSAVLSAAALSYLRTT